jgi:hypothetical protein
VVDPISGAAIGAVVLTEGIKFLYGQATELLKRWRERRDSATATPAPEPILRPPADLIEGSVEPARPDYGRLERLQPELQELRRSLADYAEDLRDVDPNDPLLWEQVDALRRMLEAVYGQRITFKGEQREPSGPLVQARISVDRVLGDAAALRARVMRRGRVDAEAEAKEVSGRLSAAEFDELG